MTKRTAAKQRKPTTAKRTTAKRAKGAAAKLTIAGHAIAAARSVQQAEGFATELRAALDDGTIGAADAEAMLAELAAAGGAAAALAAYVEGVIGRKPRRAFRTKVKKVRRRT